MDDVRKPSICLYYKLEKKLNIQQVLPTINLSHNIIDYKTVSLTSAEDGR